MESLVEEQRAVQPAAEVSNRSPRAATLSVTLLRRIPVRFACIYGLSVIFISLLNVTATAQDAPYKQQENLVYGEAHGIGLLMDAFTPTGNSNGLAVVDVVSGAWYSDRGKIRDHMR